MGRSLDQLELKPRDCLKCTIGDRAARVSERVAGEVEQSDEHPLNQRYTNFVCHRVLIDEVHPKISVSAARVALVRLGRVG